MAGRRGALDRVAVSDSTAGDSTVGTSAAGGPTVDVRRPALAAILFDRDGTLVRDVPYNGDPALVELLPGAAAAVARTRAAGLRTGLVSNQSGIGRGLLTGAQVAAVNARVLDLVGGLDTVQICPHAPEAGCDCRKPAPGMVLAAARDLGLEAAACAVLGDIGTDVRAAAAAGARGVLIPTPATRGAEVAAAPLVAGSLGEALDLLGVPR